MPGGGLMMLLSTTGVLSPSRATSLWSAFRCSRRPARWRCSWPWQCVGEVVRGRRDREDGAVLLDRFGVRLSSESFSTGSARSRSSACCASTSASERARSTAVAWLVLSRPVTRPDDDHPSNTALISTSINVSPASEPAVRRARGGVESRPWRRGRACRQRGRPRPELEWEVRIVTSGCGSRRSFGITTAALAGWLL